MPNNRHACVSIGPEPGPRGADRWIPSQQLRRGDGVLASFSIASLVSRQEVKGVAVIYHAGLRGRWSYDTVGWLGRRRCSWRRSGRRVSNDRYTYINIRPKTRASIANRRIEGEKLGERNAVSRRNGVAAGIRWDEIECVAVVHHERLGGLRSGNPIA
jgi:hypothetical protein